jgi:hypothetical protein
MMSEKQDERRRDEELAAFTDTLLEGEPEADAYARPPLASTVERLARAIDSQPVPAHLRRRVRRQIATEWPELHRPWGGRLHRWLGSPGQPRLRWAWVATGALVVLALAAALLLPADGLEITGTAPGQMDAAVLILVVGIIAALALGLLVAWLLSRRR